MNLFYAMALWVWSGGEVRLYAGDILPARDPQRTIAR